MTYQYIIIKPVEAPIDQVLDENSEYSRGVKSETTIANASNDLLEACIEALSLFDNYPECYEAIGTFQVLNNAIAKAKGQS